MIQPQILYSNTIIIPNELNVNYKIDHDEDWTNTECSSHTSSVKQRTPTFVYEKHRTTRVGILICIPPRQNVAEYIFFFLNEVFEESLSAVLLKSALNFRYIHRHKRCETETTSLDPVSHLFCIKTVCL